MNFARSIRSIRSAGLCVSLLSLVSLAAPSALAGRRTIEAAGTISSNSSSDATIPIGTPWSFELTYETAAPDLASDPTVGVFTNITAPPALVAFHYLAGVYEVTIDNPADFGPGSAILITFERVNAIDINLFAATAFPPLAGGTVSFHADFNAFSHAPIFSSDSLPSDTALGLDDFDESTVSLLPAAGGAVSSSTLTRFAITGVPGGCGAGCPGDADCDGDADIADLAVLLSQFGTSGTALEGDFDDDGEVDLRDLSLLLAQFGMSC